ncbi:hypothetical protein [Streptomyces sp. NBC_00986]|uniref:hypothetical protein n=1 Tax=Streptomyces sp. NBC_00986 TaxID=2903702 RepID=UPI00386E9256|nr:hypothetical protein OG504_51645 [Streptomyces sp. NBC_00986]
MSKLVGCTTVVHTLRSRTSPTGPVRLSGGLASTPSIPVSAATAPAGRQRTGVGRRPRAHPTGVSPTMRDMADGSVLLVENPSANGVSLNGGLA